jgi:hypothetical protein
MFSKQSNDKIYLNVVCGAAVVAVLAFGLGLIGVGTGGPEEAEAETKLDPAAKKSCAEKLQRIGKALQAYHKEHGTYPPAYLADDEGTPQHSWRVLLLTYLDEKDLYAEYKFDEPWNGPNNAKLADRMPDVFRCDPDSSEPTTSFVGVIGPLTVWKGKEATKLEDITDDVKQTILLIESPGVSVPWLSPEDPPYEKLGLTLKSKREHGENLIDLRGGQALFADGKVREIPEDLPSGSLRKLLEIDDGEAFEF